MFVKYNLGLLVLSKMKTEVTNIKGKLFYGLKLMKDLTTENFHTTSGKRASLAKSRNLSSLCKCPGADGP